MDDPKGIENNIKSFTISMSRLGTFPKTQGAWSKLCLFHHKITKTLEVVVFLDIDTVLTVTLIRSLATMIASPNAKLRPTMETVDPSFEPMRTTGLFTYRLSFYLIIFDAFHKDLELACRNNVLIKGFLQLMRMRKTIIH